MLDRISVITPTFRREDLLARCVQSVLAQEVDAEIEHIVVNDAGEPLKPAKWMADPRVMVLNTYRTERSVARNTGAALSRGQWLYFLDDDDYALPGAFAALLELTKKGDNVLVYGAHEADDVTDQKRWVIAPKHQGDLFPLYFSGGVIPIQSIWVRRDSFFASGCFDPLLHAFQDVDLFQRVSRLGTAIGTTTPVAVVRINHPTTTHTSKELQKKNWREVPERWMAMPGTVSRLRKSTRSSPYWTGRCTRTYAISTLLNVRKRRFHVAAGRTLTAGLLVGWHLLSPAFWHGLRGR